MEEVTLLLGGLTLAVRGRLSRPGEEGDQGKKGEKPPPEPPRGGDDVAPSEPEPETCDIRFYCVSANPHSPESVGIWFGPHPRTWNRIRGHLRGGRLAGSGATLSRHPSLEEARRRWAAGWHAGMAGSAALPPMFHVA